MARRHEGNIVKEGSKYRARITFNGKRYSASGFATKQEARRWIRELVARLERGTRVNDKITLAEYLTDWLELKRQRIRPNSFRCYSTTVNTHIIPTLGHIRLSQLSALDIEMWYNRLIQRGNKPSTAALRFHVLRQALSDAVRLKLVDRNVALDVKPIPSRKSGSDQSVWRIEYAKRLIEGCATQYPNLYPVVCLAFYTGLRLGELVGLQWQDIDWERGVLYVTRQAAMSASGRAELAPLKTESARRMVSLPPEALDALRIQLEYVKAWRLKPGWEEHDLVFPNPHGGVRHPGAVSGAVARVCRKLGLPDGFTFHTLRHLHATVLLSRGAPIRAVSDRLGHSKATTTLSVYAHVLPQAQEELRRLASGVFEFAENVPNSVDFEQESCENQGGV